ncbi:MAG: hypothetical protein IJ758_04635, partial [Clostridia bacterium]|nr:hypothetical protein [Clostridia bacterium]
MRRIRFINPGGGGVKLRCSGTDILRSYMYGAKTEGNVVRFICDGGFSKLRSAYVDKRREAIDKVTDLKYWENIPKKVETANKYYDAMETIEKRNIETAEGMSDEIIVKLKNGVPIQYTLANEMIAAMGRKMQETGDTLDLSRLGTVTFIGNDGGEKLEYIRGERRIENDTTFMDIYLRAVSGKFNLMRRIEVAERNYNDSESELARIKEQIEARVAAFHREG